MVDTEKIQEHLDLSRKYLDAAVTLSGKKNWEPAIFNVLHAIELSIKAALYTVIEEDLTTHRVAGAFGEHFRERAGHEICREIAKTLARYNLPRYPGSMPIESDDVAPAIELGRKLLEEIVPEIIEIRTEEE